MRKGVGRLVTVEEAKAKEKLPVNVMPESQFTEIQRRVSSILVGLNIRDTFIVLLSLVSGTAVKLLKMPREDFIQMCGEFYDRRKKGR